MIVPPKMFKKKPVVIEAMPYIAGNHNAVLMWVRDSNGTARINKDHQLEIETLEGTMTAEEGWFVIRGIEGEFYPCKASIFMNSYEPA